MSGFSSIVDVAIMSVAIPRDSSRVSRLPQSSLASLAHLLRNLADLRIRVFDVTKLRHQVSTNVIILCLCLTRGWSVPSVAVVGGGVVGVVVGGGVAGAAVVVGGVGVGGGVVGGGVVVGGGGVVGLSLIHIGRCAVYTMCKSRWST